MKKRKNISLILFGLVLFIPFHYCRCTSSIIITEQILHLLGIFAMVGIIIVMIGLLNLSSKIELKIVQKNNSLNNHKDQMK